MRAGDPVQLQALTEIGAAFRTALKLAKREPGTLRHSAAWRWAEQAMERLCGLVEDVSIAAAVAATAARVRR